MNKTFGTIGSRIFPKLYALARNVTKSITNPTLKTLNLHREFKNSGYIRKIHSISKSINLTNSESFHIAESTFYRGEHRRCITCHNNDLLLISDYYTNANMDLFNKLTLIQCNFNKPKNYEVICVKEAPLTKAPLRELESEIVVELSKLDDIKII